MAGGRWEGAGRCSEAHQRSPMLTHDAFVGTQADDLWRSATPSLPSAYSITTWLHSRENLLPFTHTSATR